MSKQCLVGLNAGRVTYITVDVTDEERLEALKHGCDSVITTDLISSPIFKAEYQVRFERIDDQNIGNGWISVEDRLPPLKTPVFAGSKRFTDGKLQWWIFERFDAGDGWLWSRLNGSSLDADFECDDDYHITHWQPLLKELKADTECKLNENC
ncbi:DUF551 domain-containing protein [Acinetobacter venetianus]|uniref:DUF551 domain-containing protein n=1 Tax=Acinetobacter venetianus TaxID=52133 RepID=UPI00214FEFB9|nr:DUF551 domain-containing protein [Acinetobacter venetianus]MCR4532492.1 DUF551 domain-containing protein [Acinetobacter venetianus]